VGVHLPPWRGVERRSTVNMKTGLRTSIALATLLLLAAGRSAGAADEGPDSRTRLFGFSRLWQVRASETLPPKYLGVANRIRSFRRPLQPGGRERQDLVLHDFSLRYGASEYVEVFLELQERFWSWHPPNSLGTTHWAISDSRLGFRARLPDRLLGGAAGLLDLGLRAEWILPVGSRNSFLAPGDSVAVRYLAGEKIHYSAGLILGTDLAGLSRVRPLRIYFNIGYRDPRNRLGNEFAFSENYPQFVLRGEGSHKALLGGLALEIPSERYSVFCEFTREHLLSASDFAKFREMPFKANLGVTFWKALPFTVGVSRLLSSDSRSTTFRPGSVFPKWEFFLSISAGGRATRPDRDGDTVPDSKDLCPSDPEDCDNFEDDDGCPDPDNDGDGILDQVDRCVDLAEDIDGFEDDDGCPDVDNDGDGVPDSVDICPDVAEVVNGVSDEDGCPDSLAAGESDIDGDGVPDRIDECPLIAEDRDGFEDEDGCPEIDNDRDGIVDDEDKCPDEAETFNNYKDKDGCPDERPPTPRR